MKYTLLALTQLILSSMDSDEINSISDTVESQQVVKIIKTVYGDIFSKGDAPENGTLFNLSASGDSDKPTLMFLPTDTVENCYWVKYDSKTIDDTDSKFRMITYVPLPEFLNRMHSEAPSEDTSVSAFTHEINGTTVGFICKNDVAPTYYSTWDDFTFIFNSYDSGIDTTLQASKTLCFGKTVPPWSETDTFICPLDDHQLLLHEAKCLAWAEVKQASHPKAERAARQQWVQFQREKTKVPGNLDYQTWTPNYGRK